MLTDQNLIDKDDWEVCSKECLTKIDIECGLKPVNEEESFNRLCMLVSLLAPSKLLVDYIGVFEKNIEEIDSDENSLIAELTEEIFGGFILRAEEGVKFGLTADIDSYFGMDLKENYPEANELFLEFVESYWTLVIFLDNMRQNFPDGVFSKKVIFQVFTHLEQNIASVFFPTPGSAHIEAKERENMQRILLSQNTKNFDIDEFIRGNPILIRDRASDGYLEWRKNIYAIVIIAFIIIVYFATR